MVNNDRKRTVLAPKLMRHILISLHLIQYIVDIDLAVGWIELVLLLQLGRQLLLIRVEDRVEVAPLGLDLVRPVFVVSLGRII